MSSKNFDTLLNFHTYVPHCVICGKDMQYILTGWGAYNVKQHVPKQRIRIRFIVKDNYLQSVSKKNQIQEKDSTVIELSSNHIINSTVTLSSLTSGELHKTCSTCHCKIITSFNFLKKENFPSLSLIREEVRYVLKGGRPLEIDNNYQSWAWGSEPTYSLRINGKYLLSPVPIDLSKFQDLKHLNKRLATIITFH